MKLKDFRIDQLHLYMKFRSFTGLVGEIVKLEKLRMDISSSRDPNILITIMWENGGISDVEYEMSCEIEYIP